MIRAVVEMFVQDQRQFIAVDIKELADKVYENPLSVGIETGIFDKEGRSIATNNFVKFKGNLCRLTIEDGQVMIKHPRHGLCPLHKYHEECQIIR